MLTYWVMFLVAAMAALAENRKSDDFDVRKPARYLLVYLLLVILIGFRWEVGGDWINYARNLRGLVGQSLSDVLSGGDPGYQLASWIALRLGWGIVGVNVICALIFSAGLLAFCREQPRPKLALLVAVPYLVIVVAMGYSRQGVAIGLAMLGLVALSRQSVVWFVAWVTLAALFHKTAIILIPIAALAAARRRIWTGLWVAVTSVVAYELLLAENYDALYNNYILTEYQSQGATVRVAMNAVPALLFLSLRNRLGLTQPERRLWTWMSLIAILFVPLLIVSPSSTAVDRMALYIIPIQIFVFSRLPSMSDARPAVTQLLKLCVVGYYGMVQFVWLFFGVNSWTWLPYQTALF